MKRCIIEPDLLAHLKGVPPDLQDHWTALCWEAAQYRRLVRMVRYLDVVTRLERMGGTCNALVEEFRQFAKGEVDE